MFCQTRGEYVERTFAHVYDTGGLRRVHLRGHPNILKRLIVHAGAFNLGLLMRHVFGRGTPRGLQGRRRPCFVLSLILYLGAERQEPVASAVRSRGRAGLPRMGGSVKRAFVPSMLFPALKGRMRSPYPEDAHRASRVDAFVHASTLSIP